MNIFAGKIPLRNLVYRVQELPPSMRSLVYDFGQLNANQMESYIQHIVADYVRTCILENTDGKDNNMYMQVKKDHSLSSCTSGTDRAIAQVLTWSQKYMRGRKVGFLYYYFFFYK